MKVALVWELGQDLGHLSAFQPLAEELLARGHEVSLIARDVTRVASMFGGVPVRILQAPVSGFVQKNRSWTASHAEILLASHYGEPGVLACLVEAWRHLFALLEPNVIVCDHAPAAMLAAASLRIPVAIYSIGFCAPVPDRPPVDLCPWMNSGEERIQASEHRFLTALNEVAGTQGVAPLKHVSDLYRVALTFIQGFAEFDPYHADRRQAYYTGPIKSEIPRLEPSWGDKGRNRIFAYLKPRFSQTLDLLSELAKLDADVLCYCPGLDTGHTLAKNLHILSEPVRMSSVLESADLVVCHGGPGTMLTGLLAGCPVIAVPTQLEQTHNAMTLHKLGLGTYIAPSQVNMTADYASQVLDSQTVKFRVKEFANRYRSFDQKRSVTFICDRIEELKLAR